MDHAISSSPTAGKFDLAAIKDFTRDPVIATTVAQYDGNKQGLGEIHSGMKQLVANNFDAAMASFAQPANSNGLKMAQPA